MWKYHKQNFLFLFFFQLFHSVLQTQAVWLALHIEREVSIGFAVGFFTSRWTKKKKKKKKLWSFEETGAEGEEGEENLAHWGSGPKLPLAKSKEDG